MTVSDKEFWDSGLEYNKDVHEAFGALFSKGDGAFDCFIHSARYEKLNGAIFELVHESFKKGWLAGVSHTPHIPEDMLK